MKKRKYVLGRALLLTALFSMAILPGHPGVLSSQAATNELQQSDVIKGTVIDETGETVIGATVLIKGADADSNPIFIQSLKGSAVSHNYAFFHEFQSQLAGGEPCILNID